MRLKKVYSNNSKFKTVEFKKSGLNFIVARKTVNSENDSAKTYNGVGKSLLVSIIHFVLGSSKKKYSDFCTKLTGWEFFLEFEINDKQMTAKRSTDNPNKIYLNDEEFAVKKFNQKLEEAIFEIPSDLAFASYRSLIPFFIRPNKKRYVDFDGAATFNRQYQTMLYNAFLLGLDVDLAQKKYNTKKEKDRIEGLEKNFKNDDLLKDYFTGNKDIELSIEEYEIELERLTGNLQNFKVAEDYGDVQDKADEIESNLFETKNEIILKSNHFKIIKESMDMEVSTNLSDIKNIYNEVNVHFSNNTEKTLNELESFYEELIQTRRKRLSEERSRLSDSIQELNKQAEKFQQELDKLLKYLGEHAALDTFIAVSDKRSELSSKLEKLKNYNQLLEEYKSQNRLLTKTQLRQNELTDEYLVVIESYIIELRDYFRGLSKQFYPDAVAGLTIANNEGDNQIRYNIDAKIESDNSDGINNVKIFCYDLLLLFKGSRHSVDFLFHDSRLFDGIDERQKATMFSILNESFTKSDKQYIATLNQNQLEELIGIFGKDKYSEFIESNIILTLTDEDDSGKLLGTTLDIDI